MASLAASRVIKIEKRVFQQAGVEDDFNPPVAKRQRCCSKSVPQFEADGRDCRLCLVKDNVPDLVNALECMAWGYPIRAG